MYVSYLIIGIMCSILIPFALLYLAIQLSKFTEKNEAIKNDFELKKLKFEIENEDNDGWSKLHYKNLYKKRKKQIKNNINTSK